MIKWSLAPQGSDEWKAARRGVRTASKFKVCRERIRGGHMSKPCIQYGMDLARERLGGQAPDIYQTEAMRLGSKMEAVARQKYELLKGVLVDEVGFAFTEDRLFGASVDGLIDTKGGWECKTMVSSDTLFKTLVHGDITEYVDQCLGAMWLLHLDWMDLTLYCADLDLMKVIRIERNEAEIEALVKDLMEHESLTASFEAELRKLMQPAQSAPTTAPAPAATPAANAVTPTALPELF
jgi:exodeoxyribonuclease (lambda-induced)